MNTSLPTAIAGLLCALSFAVMTPDAAAAERDLQTVMKEATEARSAGDLKRVVALLEEAYALRPAPQILNNLGKMYEQLGDYRSAYAAYKKVADDPAAPQDLRALDTARINGLRPKLNHAWLRPSLKPEGTRLLVDGKEAVLDVDGEAQAPKGRHALQFISPDGASSSLRIQDLPIGQRLDVTVNLSVPDPLGCKVTFGEVGATLATLQVDSYPIGGALSSLKELRMAPGTYQLKGTRTDGTGVAGSLTLSRGDTRSLDEVLASVNPPAPETSVKPLDAPSAVTVSIRPRTGFPLAQMLTAGGGVAAAALGAALVSMGRQERDGLTGRAQQAQSQLDALAILNDGNAKADQLETLGVAALGAGLAAASAGLTWWVISPAAATDSAQLQPPRLQLKLQSWGSGVRVRGSF